MEIILAKHCGFCKGVQTSLSLVDTAQPPVYLYGDLIHNEGVISKLRHRGVFSYDSLEQLLALPKGTVIIRAHGVTKSDYYALSASQHTILDGTCVNVKKIRDIAIDLYSRGYQIILIGNASHPEILGVNSWIDNSAIIIESDNLQNLPVLDPQIKYATLVQTTFSVKKYNFIINYIKNNIKILVNNNTICYTTLWRQQEAEQISAVCDTVFVIGDSKSANTTNLLNLASEHCKCCYLITDINSLKAVNINITTKKLGILAGASAPLELIMEVVNLMSNSQDENGIVNNANETGVTNTEETTNQVNAEAEQAQQPVQDQVTETSEVAEQPVEEKASEQAAEVAEVAPQSEATVEQAAKAEERVLDLAQETKSTKTKKMTFADTQKEEDTFAVKNGQIRECVIVQINDDGLIVGFGGKKDGFVDKKYVCAGEYKKEDYKVGDKFNAMVIENTQKLPYITFNKIIVDEIEEKEAQVLNGEVFSVKIEKAVDKGLIGHVCTLLVFIPASQIDFKRIENENLKDYVGQTLEVIKMPDRETAEEPKRKNTKRVVASRKMVLNKEWLERKEQREVAKKEKEEKRELAKKEAFTKNLDKFVKGNVVEGVVKRFTVHGVFVNVFGFDCLCRSVEISWSKNKDAENVFKINNKYEFLIIDVDENPEKPQVSLSYRQLQKRPYELAMEKYPVGTKITGVVQKIESYGAFIAIEEGIDGLVHISNICNGKRISHPSEVLTVGQSVEAIVISFVDTKISLSIKACQPAAERTRRNEDGEEITEEEYKKNLAERKANKESYFANKSGIRDDKGSTRKSGNRKSSAVENQEPEIYTDDDGSVKSTIGDLGFLFNDDDDGDNGDN